MTGRSRWTWMAAGAAFGLAVGCGGSDDSGAARGNDVPPAGIVPTGGTSALPPMTPPTMVGTGGTGAAPMAGTAAMPMAGTAATPMAGTAAMPMAGTAAMPMAGTAAMPMAGTGEPPDPSSCAPAPDGASAGQIEALDAINSARLAAGADCVNMVAEINLAAERHCQYYAMNANTDCTADPHGEVMGCAGYVGGLRTRLEMAGYMPGGRFFGGGEVMAFSNNPTSAVNQWINSVWHRIPMLSPWSRDMGYGAAERCDTMDFGAGSMAPADTLLVYPYDGQTGVPPSFNGAYEGPMPPAPPTGWPSAMPITLYGRELDVTEHVLTKDGDTTPIEHTWIDGNDPMWSQFLQTSVFMYGHAPFEANTTYRVRMKGTYVGGEFEREWTFTTGERSRFGF